MYKRIYRWLFPCLIKCPHKIHFSSKIEHKKSKKLLQGESCTCSPLTTQWAVGEVPLAHIVLSSQNGVEKKHLEPDNSQRACSLPFIIKTENCIQQFYIKNTPNTYLYEKSEEMGLVFLCDESAHSSFSSARITSAVHGTNNNIKC